MPLPHSEIAMARVLIVEGPLKGQSFDVGDGASVGRSRSCVVRNEGRHVSRVHARFEKRGDQLFVVDNDSRNGIFVNGHKVKEKGLEKDDEIEVGEYVLVYEPSFEVKPDAKAPEPPKGAWQAVVQPPPPEESTRRGFAPKASTAILDSLLDPFAEAADADPKEVGARQRRVLETLKAVHAVEEDGQLVKALLDQLVDGLKAARGFLLLTDDRGKLAPAARRAPSGEDEFHLSNVLFHQVAREKRAVIATDRARGGASAGTPVSVLAAPLIARGTVIGFVYLEAPAQDATPPKPVFTGADLRYAAAVAALAAPALAYQRRVAKLNRILDAARRRIEAQHRVIGDAPGIRQVAEHLEAVAPTDATVLILGETGTGKEVVARSLHARGGRATGPFVAINCAAVPAAHMEAALFGTAGGAAGVFEQAHGGTLFLDEVGALTAPLQERVAKVLEGDRFTRVGGGDPMVVDVRVAAASSQDLEKEMREGRFRQDLYWKLAVVLLKIPPLRDRREDIPKLVRHFLEGLGNRVGGTVEDHVAPEVIDRLKAHAWPKNVRELRMVVEAMLVKAGAGKITLDHVPPGLG
jgi:transcriptional regulator with GAF, ATPase, and Fis domain